MAGESLFKEKGSRFLGFAVHCKTESEAKQLIAAWRKEHHQAVHVCSALRLGSDKKHYRSSDDGEPSNSAGPPILGQILSFDLTNVLVAVVRYYGGTNLGVGGLIQAYRTAAKEAIEQADIIETEDKLVVEVLFNYDKMPDVMQLVKTAQLTVSEQQFELSCRLICQYTPSQAAVLHRLRELKDVKVIEHGITT